MTKNQELIDNVSLIYSVFALSFQIFLIGVLLFFVLSKLNSSVKTAFTSFFSLLQTPAAGWFLFSIALFATGGSLFFSEVANYLPCGLCYWQRIFMYPLTIILFISAYRRDGGAFYYGLPLAVIGSLFSIYHIYIEQNPQKEGSLCEGGAAPCAVKWINEFGYITIPTLALTAFLMIILFSLAQKPSSQEKEL